MSLIRTRKIYRSPKATKQPVLLMAGFGGSVWQLKRLVLALTRDGHDVYAIDFPKTVLSKGDPDLLLQLADEVTEYAEELTEELGEPIQLVGVSLGALMALNILRRSPTCNTGVLITGGDIADIARKLYPKVWKQSYAQLAKVWEPVNMYSSPEELRGKRLLFVLHPSNKLIDTAAVRAEIQKQQAAGNALTLVERKRFDHLGTIIEETIIYPGRTLGYIETVTSRS